MPAGKLIIIIIVFLFSLLRPFPGDCAGNREPVWAGAFYPADPVVLRNTVKRYIYEGGLALKGQKIPHPPRIILFPHAGYRYSGKIAGVAAAAVAGGGYHRVIVLAPDHRVGFNGVATRDSGPYLTPLGPVGIDPAAASLLSSPVFVKVPASDAVEHAVEVLLPFLKESLGDFTMIPLVASRVEPERLAEAIIPLLNDETLLAVSSDLSHYLDYEQAVAHDLKTLRAIKDLDLVTFRSIKNSACGRVGIAVAMIIAKRLKLSPVILARANSGDTAGERGRVVGYAAMAFYERSKKEPEVNKMADFDQAQGRALLLLARRSILARFNRDLPEKQAGELEKSLADPAFKEKRGVFVTLNRRGQLRGCIGSLAAVESIREGVRRNALNAAFGDPRFSPLSEEELDGLEIEVSLLTEATPLAINDSNDLLAKLRPGIDGVIIRDGIHTATFLPQVWEQLPDPADFLSHLCRKAGMAPDRWQRPGLTVLTYQVQYFSERQ